MVRILEVCGPAGRHYSLLTILVSDANQAENKRKDSLGKETGKKKCVGGRGGGRQLLRLWAKAGSARRGWMKRWDLRLRYTSTSSQYMNKWKSCQAYKRHWGRRQGKSRCPGAWSLYNMAAFLKECWAVLNSFSCVQLVATPWTVARQAPLSMGFPRQEY